MRRLATYSSCYTLILSSEYEDQGKKMGMVGAVRLDLEHVGHGENTTAYKYLAILVDILRKLGRDSARCEDLGVGLYIAGHQYNLKELQ